jgi:antitoxin PrlF
MAGMVKKGAKDATGKVAVCMSPGCCKVEAVVPVDERGQMVLPKEVRDRAGIRPGDKLAVTLIRGEAGVCCIALMKVDALSEMVKDMLGPVMKEVL